MDLWKIEIAKYPWRYTHGMIDELDLPTDAVREYCIGVVKEAYTGGVRYPVNFFAFQQLNRAYPRETFRLEVELYKTLIKNEENRREVAYDWLARHFPNQLRAAMEQVEPHTPLWWSLIEPVEPFITFTSRHAVKNEGRADVCGSCGDRPAHDYRLANGAETMPGVPSLRLCGDCLEIRRDMGYVLMPFLSRE